MTNIQVEQVVISLTTIDSRISHVGMVLESLLSQSYSNYCIFLYISKNAYLLDKGIDDIPSELVELEKNNDNLFIEFTENIGPYRKLIPALRKYWGTNQLLVTVDDDVIYPENFLATLIMAEKIHRCPVAFRGRKAVVNGNQISSYKEWKKNELAGRSFSNVPTGKDGVVYRPHYFRESVLDISKALDVAKTTDDLWFKWNTALNGYESCLLFDSLSDSFQNAVPKEEAGVTLFDEFNQHGKNDEVISALETYFKSIVGNNLYDIVRKGG